MADEIVADACGESHEVFRSVWFTQNVRPAGAIMEYDVGRRVVCARTRVCAYRACVAHSQRVRAPVASSVWGTHTPRP